METGIHELTAGYALDSLDEDERRAYEEHLESCERCREDLASFWEVTGALALAATGPEPPPQLREQILDSVRAESQNVVPLRPRRFGPPQAFGALAAIAAVALVALGWWAISLHNRLADTRSALSAQQNAALVLADPSARRIPLAAGTGSLVSGTDGSVLIVDGLSPAPSGKTYQVWIVRGGARPASSGLFAGGDHSVVFVRHSLEAGDVVAVTLERAGGAKAPTSAPVAASHPV